MSTQDLPEKNPAQKPKSKKIAKPAIEKKPLLGTQSICRAVAILREISSAEATGMRAVDIANVMNLERPTAHRIMRGLLSQGMVTQDPRTKLYQLGPVIYELGLAAAPHYSLREICQPSLQSIANRSGDSVFLVVRSGMDGVCIDRVEGNFPIKARTLDIGGRRPLGVGAGSLAILLELSDDEIEQAIAINAQRLPPRLTEDRLRRAIKSSRELGYALNAEDVLTDITAIGVPIRQPNGACHVAMSLAGITSRLSGPRREEMAQMLRKEARILARKLYEPHKPDDA
jgi:DNA-binding IclR family transcriptional regulator